MHLFFLGIFCKAYGLMFHLEKTLSELSVLILLIERDDVEATDSSGTGTRRVRMKMKCWLSLGMLYIPL